MLDDEALEARFTPPLGSFGCDVLGVFEPSMLVIASPQSRLSRAVASRIAGTLLAPYGLTINGGLLPSAFAVERAYKL